MASCVRYDSCIFFYSKPRELPKYSSGWYRLPHVSVTSSRSVHDICRAQHRIAMSVHDLLLEGKGGVGDSSRWGMLPGEESSRARCNPEIRAKSCEMLVSRRWLLACSRLKSSRVHGWMDRRSICRSVNQSALVCSQGSCLGKEQTIPNEGIFLMRTNRERNFHP